MTTTNLNSIFVEVDAKVVDEVDAEVAVVVADKVAYEVTDEAGADMLAICDHSYAQKTCPPFLHFSKLIFTYSNMYLIASRNEWLNE
ncbi:hypothetical protein V6N12_050808 [Hibiscus sabdariffa]|uniref:Uncharacterized protein n=1 Tax=Hibiscus sabdariffa TaxID=183260 RepID=A0ABR2GDM8_9ROSI